MQRHPRPALAHIIMVCMLVMVMFSGGIMALELYRAPFPSSYDTVLHAHDLYFVVFWYIPTALVVVVTAVVDAHLSYQDREGVRTPTVTPSKGYPLWVTRPIIKSFQLSYGNLLVLSTFISLNALQFLGYYHRKLSMGIPPWLSPDQAKLNIAIGGVGFMASWNLAYSLFFYSRNQLMCRYTGMDMSRMILWHKYLASAAIWLYTIHGGMALYMYYHYDTPDKSRWESVGSNLSPRAGNWSFDAFFGLLSWGCFVMIFLGATEPVRRKSYVLFMWSHQLWIPAILFGMFHTQVGESIWAR